MDKKAIVVFSGGLDSTTLLHYVKSLGYEVYGISFDYNQRHKKELDYAKYWGKKLCKEFKIIDISFMKQIADNSSLLNDKEIPHDHYTNENQKITVVPNRNMIMLSIAVAWAENIKAEKVFFGPHANDYTIYPDCRPDFVDAINKASKLATYNHIKIEAPFVDIQKWQIVSLGTKLGIDYSKTWSCYEGKEKHCGKCSACQERKETFKILGIKDPTEYDVE